MKHDWRALTRCRWAPAWCQEEGWWGRRTACSDGRSFRLEEERRETAKAAQESSYAVLYQADSMSTSKSPRQHRKLWVFLVGKPRWERLQLAKAVISKHEDRDAKPKASKVTGFSDLPGGKGHQLALIKSHFPPGRTEEAAGSQSFRTR